MSTISRGDNAWWRLGAAETVQRAEALAWDAQASHHNLTWIGRDWDGRSDLELGGGAVTAEAMSTTIDMLRAGLVAQGVQVAALPDHRSVRQLPSASYWPSRIVVDVDFGPFIQPFRIGAELVDSDRGDAIAEVTAAMMDAILRFHAVRDQVAELHVQLRTALVEQSAVAEVVPLWFRSPPYIPSTYYPTPMRGVHEMALLMLDEDLRLVSNEIRLVSSVAEVEQYLGFHGDFQRRPPLRAPSSTPPTAPPSSPMSRRGCSPRAAWIPCKCSPTCERREPVAITAAS